MILQLLIDSYSILHLMHSYLFIMYFFVVNFILIEGKQLFKLVLRDLTVFDCILSKYKIYCIYRNLIL